MNMVWLYLALALTAAALIRRVYLMARYRCRVFENRVFADPFAWGATIAAALLLTVWAYTAGRGQDSSRYFANGVEVTGIVRNSVVGLIVMIPMAGFGLTAVQVVCMALIALLQRPMKHRLLLLALGLYLPVFPGILGAPQWVVLALYALVLIPTVLLLAFNIGDSRNDAIDWVSDHKVAGAILIIIFLAVLVSFIRLTYREITMTPLQKAIRS